MASRSKTSAVTGRRASTAARVALALHGGAGDGDPAAIDEAVEGARRLALAEVLARGRALLHRGVDAVSVVETCVAALEDFEGFNAGRGSVLTTEGTVEMDAAIADGASLRVGAVAAVRTLRNPIRAARMVLDQSRHVLLVGEGAERFCRSAGAETAPPEYFLVARPARGSKSGNKARMKSAAGKMGTVGAVARDRSGHLAAATSTGGISRKLPGRVGDSPVPGAGVFADDATCAVSATGDGEAILCAQVAHEIDAMLRLTDSSLPVACAAAMKRLVRAGGRGGVIAVDSTGAVTCRYSARFLYRAWFSGEGAMRVAVT
ncbi:MAG TPA: isoaspartyl peptidase/L-asparaginase [Candidatus Limnocylindrales bacterium]|nr:isoaspartyl peptidase/L-asparaginase [Candidatus Limnocylindrales bacterium]